MNRKKFYSAFLAILLAALILTSCAGNPSHGASNTTDSSSTQGKEPVTDARDFATSLQNALLNEVQSNMDIEIREKHQYNPSSAMEKAMFAKWLSDFSAETNPRFSFSMQRNPNAEAPEVLIFYDEGFLYVKDSHSAYRQPAVIAQAVNKIPCDGLTALFGNGLIEAFSEAEIEENAAGTVTATVRRSLFDGTEEITGYLALFGIEASGHEYGVDGDPCEIVVSVRMDDGRLLAYTIETVMAGMTANRETYPVTYSVKAVLNPIGNDFTLSLPDEGSRKEYMEAEPEISDISAEEFLRRFEKSDERSNTAIYTEMITNSTVTYEFSESYWVKIPILNVTAIDLSKPKAPKIAITESKWTATGALQKKEVYYKDDMYYYTANGRRFAISYPAEEYLADVEAAAKEKAEAGISSFFLSADMLANAVLTVNPDQSVSAVMDFDGTTQEKNIFHQIKSVYNDDLSVMMNGEFLSCSLAVTLDRFNYLTSYTLTVTAEIESNGTRALATYAIQYHFDYSETPREIQFPADLDEWGAGTL